MTANGQQQRGCPAGQDERLQQDATVVASTPAPRLDKQGMWRPEISEVVAAVESLYSDQLKPFGRILLKRVRERGAETFAQARRAAGDASAVADADAVPLIDPKCLRRICEFCSDLAVEAEDGKEYSVTLVGRSAVFVDVCSPEDPYPPALWAGAAAYFESLQGDDFLLPGGRYACAQVLIERNLPFLQNRSLGEVCHIVQLSVSQKRILGYWDGNMVPFGRSVDCIKEQCAAWQQPVSFKKAATVDLPLATWEQARACLWDILEHANACPKSTGGAVTLSNVKRLFRSRFGLELSETALGHSRLNELLQDVRLSDICRLELQGKSQVVVQRASYEGYHVDHGACAAGYWPGQWAANTYLDTSNLAMCNMKVADGLDPNAVPWVPSSATTVTEPSVACFSTAPTTARSRGAPTEEETIGNSAMLLTDCVRRLLELDHDKGRDVLQQLSTYNGQAPGADGSSEIDGAAAADETFVGSALPARGPGGGGRGGSQKRGSNKIPRSGPTNHRETLSACLSTSDEGASGQVSDDDSDGETESKSAKSGLGKDRGSQSRSPAAVGAAAAPPPGLKSPPGL